MADNSVLSLAEMDEISDALDVLRPSMCVVSRPTGEIDEAGAEIGNFDTIGSFACRVDESTGGVQRVVGPAVAATATATVAFRRGVSIRARDLIEEAGRVFRVIYVPDPSYSFETVVPVTSVSSRRQGGGVKR